MKDLINEILNAYIEKRVREEKQKYIQKIEQVLSRESWHNDYKNEIVDMVNRLLEEVNKCE